MGVWISITGFLKPYKFIDFVAAHISPQTKLCISKLGVLFSVNIFPVGFFSLVCLFGAVFQFKSPFWCPKAVCMFVNVLEAPGLFSDGFVGKRKIPLAESKSLQLHCYRLESVTTIETSC